MYPSSALCRTQEGLQRDRALNTPLPNVRRIAERAAAAWGVEGRLAEKREQRQETTRKIALAELNAKRRECEEKHSISGDPTRGMAASAR